jgi:hypothetical protein
VGVTSVILSVVDTKGATAQATANVTVQNPGFTLAPTLPSVSVTAGGTATEHITFTPNPGLTTAMTLACSGLPARASCSFSPATVAAGSVQTDVVVTISTTKSASAAMAQSRTFYAGWMPFTGLGLLGMVFLIPGKRRKAPLTILTLLVLSGLTFTLGCGGSNGTPKGTFMITVSGTAGNVTQTTTFSLTVD